MGFRLPKRLVEQFEPTKPIPEWKARFAEDERMMEFLNYYNGFFEWLSETHPKLYEEHDERVAKYMEKRAKKLPGPEVEWLEDFYFP